MPARRFDPVGPLRGELRPPPDKSISHRAALFAAMGEGRGRVEGYLDSADTGATLAAVAALGAAVDSMPGSVPGSIDLQIDGIGLRGPGDRAGDDLLGIDVGNAGTLLRILPGWLAGQERGAWSLDGDESIRRRPVDRVAEPLALMGARVECRDGRLPPLRIDGAPLVGVPHRLAIASAQVKSCLLLAGLLADGTTEVTEPATTRDHTERMLAAAGVEVLSEDLRSIPHSEVGPARRIAVSGVDHLEPAPAAIPGDFSSAAFFLVGALLVPGSEVVVREVGINPTRVGLLGILTRMGAAIEVREGGSPGGEPRGTIVARAGPLAGTRVGAAEVPLAIDELPLVALAGCFAEGETVVTGAGELRHKESDRIAAVVEGLRSLGGSIEALPDGFAVTGGGLRGGALDARGDHRLAMLGAIAGLASGGGAEVAGMDAATVSFPGFEADLASLRA